MILGKCVRIIRKLPDQVLLLSAVPTIANNTVAKS